MDRLRLSSRVIFAAVIALMTLILTACPQERTVAQIQRDPARYANKEIGIRGTVISSWGALGTGMYEVDDGTGRIWVMSQNYGCLLYTSDAADERSSVDLGGRR